MSRVLLLAAAAVGWLLQASGAKAADDAWKIDAMACREMVGAPGTAYRTTCRTHDQYDSALACVKALNETGTEERMRAAGRDAVDAYMRKFPTIEGCRG